MQKSETQMKGLRLFYVKVNLEYKYASLGSRNFNTNPPKCLFPTIHHLSIFIVCLPV